VLQVCPKFVYDGDGNMVKRDSTVLIGNYYEYTNGSAKKFYYAGGVRIAVRPASDNVARWLLSDHLGSTAKTVSSVGATEGEQRYMPFGLDRYEANNLNTAYRYTGQRIEDNVDLYYYVSRWYDPVVGRFIQPDSIVPEPGNPQSLNRYAYTLNNPVRYTDPTGHWAFEQTPEDQFFIPAARSPSGSTMRVETDPCFSACTGPAPVDDQTRAILETIAGVAWEPADWAITFAHWGSGDFHVLDLAGLLPLVPASVTRVVRNADEVVEVANVVRRWQVGDPIEAATRNGAPSWSAVRSRYWMSRAETAPAGIFTDAQLARMRSGRPPLQEELQVPMELHHIEGRNVPNPHGADNLQELWPWQHARIDPHRYYNGPVPDGE
jgi:RHS repeat-associated protein